MSQTVLSLRDRKEAQNTLLKKRLETIIPALWEGQEFDTWLIIGAEYNEDPVLMTMLPQNMMNATRTTAIIFHRDDDRRPRILSSIGSRLRDFYRSVWDIQKEDFWDCLARILKEIGTKRLGLNYSHTCKIADGISHTIYEKIADRVSPDIQILSAENMASDWLQIRTDEEIGVLRFLDGIAHRNIHKVFSPAHIQPGVTTTEDLEWMLREIAAGENLGVWFHPDVDFQRQGEKDTLAKGVIQKGDLLHCDYGLTYLGLNSDTQRIFYVLKDNETDAPEGLKEALTNANRLQTVVMDQFVSGRTGNDVLTSSLAIAREMALDPMIYTHPIGFHGHAAGPTIGLWNQQTPIEGAGDLDLKDCTAYALELNCKTKVPQWADQQVIAYLEETVVFHNAVVDVLDGLQTQLFTLLCE